MGLIFALSLRNLLRQKRRNLFLGMGIAFGMMILVVANSFSHGMVDVLIKEVVSNAFGHLVIQGKPGNNPYEIIREKERMVRLIHNNIKRDDIVDINENLGMFCRAVGNGETDNVVVVGITLDNAKEKRDFFEGFFTLVDGNFDDFYSKDIEYPVIISAQKAKSLNVKLHDVVRARLPMVTGQVQAAKLTVVAIANSNNTFMDIVLFMEGKRVKELLGYKPWEAGSIQITLKDPKRTAEKYANILHDALKPQMISISGRIGTEDCQMVAFRNNESSKRLLRKYIRVVDGDSVAAFTKDGVMLSGKMARKLNLKAGDEVVYQYRTKYRGSHEEKYTINAVYESETELGGSVLLLNEEKIHDTFNRFLPRMNNPERIGKDAPFFAALATEWKLYNRSHDSQELAKKYKKDRKVKTDQQKFDVVTMYEGASDILKLEGVLNLVTVIAVLVLFFIILIGVVNTLRMTIKERTREIGTIRAIGMQKADVRNTFIMETMLLTAFSCAAGIVMGIIAMWILGAITFDVHNVLSMILKDKRLFFKPNFAGILSYFILILLISGVTAFFPARRAANLSAVEALRHYE